MTGVYIFVVVFVYLYLLIVVFVFVARVILEKKRSWGICVTGADIAVATVIAIQNSHQFFFANYVFSDF